MKKLSLFIAAIVAGQLLYAQIPNAYYKLNGNAKDELGYHNGKIHGSVTAVPDRFGNPGAAMYFPGNTESYIEIDESSSFELQSISIAAWVNVTSQNALSTFVDKAISCINDSWHLGTENNNFSAWVSNTTACGDFVQLTTPLTTGVWKHIVFTVDGNANTRKLYIDGSLAASGTYTAKLRYKRYPVLLGAAIENDVVAFPLNGTMDNVRIYDGVLSETEIMNIYNNIETCNKIDDDEDGLIDETCTPFLSVDAVYMDEGNSDTSIMKLPVTLSNVYVDTVSVRYITVDKTATAASDYIAVKGEIIFAPGEQLKYIKIPIIGDTIPERDERFHIKLYKPVNISVSYTADGNILNDDLTSAATAVSSNAIQHNVAKIYPNPAKDFISVTGIAANTIIEITDMQGRIILKQTISNNIALNISTLTLGVYFLKYADGANYKTIKFVKE